MTRVSKFHERMGRGRTEIRYVREGRVKMVWCTFRCFVSVKYLTSSLHFRIIDVLNIHAVAETSTT